MYESALRQARSKMDKLQLAQQKCDDPEFGVCMKCKGPIPMGRLFLMPESFCCLTFLSMSDNEMADMLGVGVNSIRVTRNRVRKKLQLGKGDDLEVLLKGF